MIRQNDPQLPLDVLDNTSLWSDYDGDVIYGDYVVDEEGDVIDTTAYLPGIGQYDSQLGDVQYFHGDQIGSVRMMTNDGGLAFGEIVYTAFGERVYAGGTVDTRYQYAGAHGYETFDTHTTGVTLPFLHVGYRHYDPATGRAEGSDWDQGGVSVYCYVFNRPNSFLDPSGNGIGWSGGGRVIALPFSVSATCGIHYSATSGNLTPYIQFGLGPGFGLGAGVSHGPVISNATGISDLKGSPGQIVIMTPVGGATLDGGSLTAGIDGFRPGIGVGGGVAGEYTGTIGFDINIRALRDFWREWDRMPPGVQRPTCFPGGTLLHTLDGDTEIDSIEAGASIWGKCASSGNREVDCVVSTHSSESIILIHIKISGETISCTPEHPFWVLGRGWMPANLLNDRYSLQDADGQRVPIEAVHIEFLDYPIRTYNISTQNTRTYYVGHSRILVHNKQ